MVNNAGIFIRHPLQECHFTQWRESWERTLTVNLTGPATVCFCAARYMIEHGGGRIVNVSSRGAFHGEPFAPAYGASKAGLNALRSVVGSLSVQRLYVPCVRYIL